MKSILLAALLCATACVRQPAETVAAHSSPPQRYMSSGLCKGCHVGIYRQHLESHHEKSSLNPLFQAQYFREVLPQTERGKDFEREAEACTACHAPLYYTLKKQHLTAHDQVDEDMPGVTCDLCHTIAGYAGGEPGNGNFLSVPGERKLGPFKRAGDWHHVYSELQTKSEFCAICHNAVNRFGLEIKATYTEWKNSRFAREGIECQDCHMTLEGHLVDGKSVYQSGKAAYMTVGGSPERKRLYTHRFPGAHSRTQLAATLSLELDTTTSPDGDTAITVSVVNTQTGHRMPTGSAELRHLWLELEARTGDTVLLIPAAPATAAPYDVSGASALDRELLDDEIPKGCRVYRVILADGSGRWTHAAYAARAVLFDNRLDASEIRRETYRFRMPAESKQPVEFIARLKYLAYPASFARSLGVMEAKPFELAVARKTLAR